MRSPTLLTGLTGTVAVLVLVYVGLTAMNLQPHITFGDPKLRMASIDTVPSRPLAATPPAEPSAPTAATVPASPAPVSPAAPPAQNAAPVPAPPSATAQPQESAGTPGAPVAASAMQSPPASSPATASPPPPAIIPEASPASPLNAPAADTPPAVAATPPEAAKVVPLVTAQDPSAHSSVELSPADHPVATTPSAVAQAPVSAESSAPPSPVVAAAEPPASADTSPSITERMAPEASTPVTLTPPLAASVPTPLPRPAPPEETVEKPAVETSSSDDKEMQAGKAAPQPPADNNKAPPADTAMLTPQPDKPADGSAVVGQPGAPLKPVDLSRPFAERAGILTIGGRSVQLAGILPTDPQRSCTGSNGKEWPCGTLARTALRSFLLGRTITCDVADPNWKGTTTAECRFAKLSIGDWLARNGWAEVASGSPFTAAADEARKAGRGVYGNDPRKAHQSTLAPEPPKDDPLNPI